VGFAVPGDPSTASEGPQHHGIPGERDTHTSDPGGNANAPKGVRFPDDTPKPVPPLARRQGAANDSRDPAHEENDILPSAEPDSDVRKWLNDAKELQAEINNASRSKYTEAGIKGAKGKASNPENRLRDMICTPKESYKCFSEMHSINRTLSLAEDLRKTGFPPVTYADKQRPSGGSDAFDPELAHLGSGDHDPGSGQPKSLYHQTPSQGESSESAER
jgi:hypothetical protein